MDIWVPVERWRRQLQRPTLAQAMSSIRSCKRALDGQWRRGVSVIAQRRAKKELDAVGSGWRRSVQSSMCLYPCEAVSLCAVAD